MPCFIRRPAAVRAGVAALARDGNCSQVRTTGPFWSGAGRVAIVAVIQVPVTLFLALFASISGLGIIRLRGIFRARPFLPSAPVALYLPSRVFHAPKGGTHAHVPNSLCDPLR